MKKITGALMVAALTVTSVAAQARELSPKEKGIIEDVTKQQLKDPESARFFWQDYKGGEIYCAHVNAKNSYGGYAGKSLLIAGVKTSSNGEIISAEVTTHNDSLMNPICTKRGYKV
jgi:hypothetical protein